MNEVERNTSELRALLNQQKINGTLSEMSDDVKVCASTQKKTNFTKLHADSVALYRLTTCIVNTTAQNLIFCNFELKSASIFRVK